MVWNTTQSAFYRAIYAFNNGEEIGENQDDNCNEKSEKNENRENLGKPGEKLPKNHKKRGDERESRPKIPPKRGNEREGFKKMPSDPPGDLSKNRCPNHRACQGCSKAPLSELFSDKDMLLIAGLIFVLSRQNADGKLILALAFVLLT